MSGQAIFCHGPDAERFSIAGSGAVVSASGSTPFHGIISRGLLEAASADPVSGCSWSEVGHRLHDDEPAGEDGAEVWRRRARECGVLQFRQSAAAARSYAARLAREPHRSRIFGPGLPAGEVATIDLWNVKEGHTSSVWRTRLNWPAISVECAINVARDVVAGRELRRTSRILRRIPGVWTDARIARVREIATVRLPDVATPVVVTCNDWIEGAWELHRAKGCDGEVGHWVAVERFIVDDRRPSSAPRMLGRRLDEEEIARVEEELAEFLARGAPFGAQVDINDGDLVWDGSRSCVVAIR